MCAKACHLQGPQVDEVVAGDFGFKGAAFERWRHAEFVVEQCVTLRQLGVEVARRVVPAFAAEQGAVADEFAQEQVDAFGDAGDQRGGYRLVDELQRAVADGFVDDVFGAAYVFEVAQVGDAGPCGGAIAPQAQAGTKGVEDGGDAVFVEQVDFAVGVFDARGQWALQTDDAEQRLVGAAPPIAQIMVDFGAQAGGADG